VRHDGDVSDEGGGDAACWLPRVCDHCGQVVERPEDHRCVRGTGLDRVPAPAGAGGVVWALSGERQLEVNLVVLGPHDAIAEHLNATVDVVIVVLDGAVTVVIEGVRRPLTQHDLLLVPRGTRRSLTAGAPGVRYLAIHIARPGPAISGTGGGPPPPRVDDPPGPTGPE
jgi:quercetin dioxygenase-like cupin family protein